MTQQQKLSVLVVDDDEFQHKIVDMVLGQANYRLAFASSGEDAIRCVQHTAVDLILMDVQMPGIGGLEAARRVKAMPHMAHVPILMVSGESNDVLLAQCLHAGASDLVVKPFNRATLPAKVALLSRLAAPMRLHAAGDIKDGT